MSKWKDNKLIGQIVEWKVFWSWVILGIFVITISILYKSERDKRIELEGHTCPVDTVFIGLGESRMYFSPIDSADIWIMRGQRGAYVFPAETLRFIDSSEVKDE